MSKFIQYSILIFVIVFIIKSVIAYILIIKKSNTFLNKHFKDNNKIYSVKEVSEAFNIDEVHFTKLIYTLEKYNYFTFFNKRGVTMVKDFYSKYELKHLIILLNKKQKLKY